jgi:hypothetical protein
VRYEREGAAPWRDDGLIQIRTEISETRRGFSGVGRRMKASGGSMWQMGTPGSLIFIGLVAAIVALAVWMGL